MVDCNSLSFGSLSYRIYGDQVSRPRLPIPCPFRALGSSGCRVCPFHHTHASCISRTGLSFALGLHRDASKPKQLSLFIPCPVRRTTREALQTRRETESNTFLGTRRQKSTKWPLYKITPDPGTVDCD